jgi:hypothetical protein
LPVSARGSSDPSAGTMTVTTSWSRFNTRGVLSECRHCRAPASVRNRHRRHSPRSSSQPGTASPEAPRRVGLTAEDDSNCCSTATMLPWRWCYTFRCG